MRLGHAITPAVLLVAASTIAACTPAGTSTTTPVPVVTVTTTAMPTTAPPTSDLDSELPDKPTTSRAKRVRLPNVVGMNLQAAQDHLQATGFYVLNDKDATGQGRLQVFDRNWEVVRQAPAAGKRVCTDTLITPYAKKIGE